MPDTTRSEGARGTAGLRALLAAGVAPSPWNTDGITLRQRLIWAKDGVEVARAWYEDDAALIVAAVNSLPALLDVVEAARVMSAPESTWSEYRKARADCRAALDRLEATDGR